MRPRKVWVGPPQFPGQELVECWSVTHIDGVGQDEEWDDFMAALKDPDDVPLWIAGKNLTLADAAALVAELMELHPERRYAILPVRLGKLA
jgi:hypothetical protein